MEVEQKGSESEKPEFKLTPVALEIGFSIAIPIVALALVGRLLDNKLGTSPILLLVGIGLSIFVSSFILWQKMKRYF